MAVAGRSGLCRRVNPSKAILVRSRVLARGGRRGHEAVECGAAGGLAHSREAARRRIEPWQIAAFSREERLESGNPLGVYTDRGEQRVVRLLGKPAVVQGKPPQLSFSFA